MSPEFEQLAERLALLISGFGESLHREMQDGFNRIDKRSDLMEARLNRHGAIASDRSPLERPDDGLVRGYRL